MQMPSTAGMTPDQKTVLAATLVGHAHALLAKPSEAAPPSLVQAVEEAIQALGDWLTSNTEKVFEEQPEIDGIRTDLFTALERAKAAVDDPIRIGITIEGGVFQDLFADDPRAKAINVMLIDYDIDHAQDDELYYVPQEHGRSPQKAYLRDMTPTMLPDAGFTELERLLSDGETVEVADAKEE